MAAFLIDYENIGTKKAIQGVEYLTKKDSVYIFYSQSCTKIRADFMAMMKERECGIHAFKLVRAGKNALDFYIASECGIISQRGETQIVIVSRDKGFSAVVDFFKTNKKDAGAEVVMTEDMESGIIALHGAEDAPRRAMIQDKVKMLDFDREYAKYQAQMEFQEKIRQTLKGTKYEWMQEKILESIGGNRLAPKKTLYTGALHHFGRENGREIYHLLKDVV